MSSIRITNTEILYQGKSRLEKITYEQPAANGSTKSHDREVFNRPNATSILLLDPERKTVLLTEQLRIPVYLHHHTTDHLLETVAGLIDEGEFPEHSVIREVEEETGYRISQIQQIAEAYSSPGAFTEYVYYFIGEYSPDLKVSEGGGLEHEGEEIKNIELSFQEARKLLLSGKIHDAKTIILLQYAIIHNMI
jgi:nudix-type nucleoside diphosphatase (YffH/AdpP family)